MAVITEIAHTKYAGAVNGGTTPSIDTSGADFLIMAAVSGSGTAATVSDAYGNTYTGRTTQAVASSATVRIHDTAGTKPTVGASHTFTASGTGLYGGVYVESFSGMELGLFDQQNGATGTGSLASKGTGAVTPLYATELVFTAVCHTSTGVATVPVAYTSNENTAYSAGVNFGGGIGWLTQSTITARGPTWTFSPNTASGAAVAIATYRGKSTTRRFFALAR